MSNDSDINNKTQRIYWIISLIFIVLGVSLQALTLLYWNRVIEPRLRLEAQSQANILASSQSEKLADALVSSRRDKRKTVLTETINEILLFSDPATYNPYFLGLDLDLDYDVISSQAGSLNLSLGKKRCEDCILSTNALFSPATDELIGVVNFRVNNFFFKNLSRDVKTTLMRQSQVVLLLLIVVWMVIIFLIKAINRCRHKAEVANRTKSVFLANMSHELRSPLNAIIGFSQLMSRDPHISTEHKKNLSIINKSGEYLLELINDVLEISKIEAEKSTVNKKVFDFHATLNSLEEMVRLRAEKKNLQLLVERQGEVPRYLQSDEKKIRQILLNLLGNAIKFTDKGRVVLRIIGNRTGKGSGAREEYSLQFEIEDTGPGISPEDIEVLFEAFTQANGSLSKQEGTGLGLSISRQFVMQLGGDLTVDSKVGEGSTFTFIIPVQTANPDDIEPVKTTKRVVGIQTTINAGMDTKFRILVVDDHDENRQLLCTLLKQVGFFVQEAQNGKQAIELNESWQPHLIWMDMRMPEVDGYEATKTIRAKARKNRPVIIALTASAFEEDRKEVLAVGCDDFVRRPFREPEIFEIMAQHLGIRYIYENGTNAYVEEKEKTGLSRTSIKAALQNLPEDTVKELRYAAELSDMDQIEQIVTDISEKDKALAIVLKEYVDTFQYDMILALLDQEEKSE